MSTLTDRYVQATARALPEEQRAEVEAELRATIADMVEAREAAGATHQDAERAALVELGEPTRLAAAYSGRRLYLLGPGVYPEWLRLVKVLLLVIVPIVALVRLAVGLFAEDLSNGPGSLIAATLGTAVTTAGHIVFWTVLGFAIVERTSTEARPLGAWDPDTLPEATSTAPIGRGETVGSLVMFVLLGLALVWQQTEGPVGRGDGEGVPLLDPALWSSWFPVLIAVLLAMAAHAVVLYRAGRWTPTLAVANLVLELAFTVPLVVLARRDRLYNPDAVAVFVDNGWTEASRDLAISTTLGLVIVAAIGIVDGFVKAYRHRTVPAAGAPASSAPAS